MKKKKIKYLIIGSNNKGKVREIKQLLPKNIKLTPDDVWRNTSFIISLKMVDPQFAGQTKTKLQSAHILSRLTPKLKDNFEIWFN